jgi:hypothetical protein
MIYATNANERELKRRLDLKAQDVAYDNSSWDSVHFEMKASVPFLLSDSDEKFLEEYVKWVQGHSNANKPTPGLRTVCGG